jgi:kynurenine formamidase
MAKGLRFVDLSVPIKEPVPGELKGLLAERLAAKIDYTDHARGVEAMKGAFGCEQEDLPEGNGWASEMVTLGTHSGTHLDAPYHFYPTSEGQPAKTISEVPLEWCYGNGVVLDFRHKKSGEQVTVADVQEALEKINYRLQAGDIVCLMYGVDKKLGTAAYWTEYPGINAAATRWILEHGVRVIATDAVGFDRPFDVTKEEFARTKDPALLWEAHRVGRDKEYCHIEKIANLDQLPPHGFKIVCFPINVYKASAGWVRPVAIIEE